MAVGVTSVAPWHFFNTQIRKFRECIFEIIWSSLTSHMVMNTKVAFYYPSVAVAVAVTAVAVTAVVIVVAVAVTAVVIVVAAAITC